MAPVNQFQPEMSNHSHALLRDLVRAGASDLPASSQQAIIHVTPVLLQVVCQTWDHQVALR